MAYTFSGSRYITSGVAENFPIELQVALFSAVEQMREKVSGQLDYLQVFEIVTRVKGQKKFLHIYHMQECPEAKLYNISCHRAFLCQRVFCYSGC